MANEKDVAKARRIWQSMNEVNGEMRPFPESQIADAIAIFAAQMEAEDPDQPVLCNNCGQCSPSSEVNLWGLCSWCQPR